MCGGDAPLFFWKHEKWHLIIQLTLRRAARLALQLLFHGLFSLGAARGNLFGVYRNRPGARSRVSLALAFGTKTLITCAPTASSARRTTEGGGNDLVRALN